MRSSASKYSVTVINGSGLVQDHRKWRRSIDHNDFLLVRPCEYSSILYRFWISGHWIISWPWNLGWRSLKVIQTGIIQKLGRGFLFAFRSNYDRIFNRLWDLQRQSIAWPWKMGQGLFKVIENGAIRYTVYDFLLVRRCKYSSIFYRF